MKSRISSTFYRGFLLSLFLAVTCVSTMAQEQRPRRGSALQQQIEANPEANPQPATEQTAMPARSRSKPVPATLDRIAEKVKITEPKTHENLSIFLIEGEDRLDTTDVLTLAEALERKGTVVVKETGNVNELTVENKDAKHTVFIMAGDIVKGGKQDRTLGTDLPLMTKSGVVPISAFCVEQGRWRARGGEEVTTFSTSANAVATKAGKVAVRRAKAQGEVWQSVAKAQEKISANIGNPVAAPTSPTSLQLSLENSALKTKNAEYFKALLSIAGDNKRAIGYVCVINGQINSAEIFAGHDLFRRAWPKLLESAATEAISEQKEKKAANPVTVEKAAEFLATAEDTAATKEKIHGDFWSVTGEGDTTLLFQTIDESNGGRWLRRSVIKK
jgi:hypothetical protein